MEDRVIKQKVIVYRHNGTPFDLTPYIQDWQINNGGLPDGDSGLDGIVQTANLTIKNSVDANFNPESEFGKLKTKVIQFVGNGGNSYSGVPAGVLVNAVGFQSIEGQATNWDSLTNWDNWSKWSVSDNTDNGDLWGEVRIVDNNFITPKPMRVGVLFEIICTYIDYSVRNEINTFDEAFNPLLDENSKIEIYASEESLKWKSHRWRADGTNRFSNPITGTPLVKAIGISGVYNADTWEELTSWDNFSSWDMNLSFNDFFTQVVEYDNANDEIVLGATPPIGVIVEFSISYFIGEPNLIFSGYIGDSIVIDPVSKTVQLAVRDKGKILQDTMIDGVINYIDYENWNYNKGTGDFLIQEVDASGVFLAENHQLETGDKVIFNNINTLPKKTDGTGLIGSYVINKIDNDKFTLDGVSLSASVNEITLSIFGTNQGEVFTFSINTTTNILTTTKKLPVWVYSTVTQNYDYESKTGWLYLDENGVTRTLNIWNRAVKIDDYNIGLIDPTYPPAEPTILNILPLGTSSATGQKVTSYQERSILVDDIYTFGNSKVVTLENHLLENNDLIRFESTGDLPKGASGEFLTEIYSAEVLSDTEFKIKDEIFTTTGSGIITVYPLVMDVDNIINNVLRDIYGKYDFYVDIESGYNRRMGVNTDMWDFKTVWDTIQGFATQKAMYLQHLFNPYSNDFELTLKTLANKETADYSLTSTDIYIQTQEITGNDIRNAISVNFYNMETGERDSVTAIDEDSISAYNTRPSIITEATSSGINSEAQAQQFADNILEATKDRIIDNQAEIPFLFKFDENRIEVGNTISLKYPYLDSTNGLTPFYAIESIQHFYNATGEDSRSKFKTILSGNKKKVRTGKKRFKRIESRPGQFKQNSGRDISEMYQIPKPINPVVQQTGLEAIALTPRAYAILQWETPENYLPKEYKLEWCKSSETYAEGEQRKIKANNARIISERVNLDTNTEYKWRVRAISKADIEGVVANEVEITGIGDNIPPSIPNGVSVVGLDEGVQVSFDPVNDADLLGYNIYVRKDNDPTIITYDKIKATNSTITVISGLVPGEYHIGVTAYDTSGNESDISTIAIENNSPKLVIRNQSDFDDWIETIRSEYGTSFEVGYQEVVFYEKKDGSAYTIDGTVYRYRIIKSKKLKLIGVGNIVVEYTGYTTGNSWLLVVESNFFECYNIGFKIIDTVQSVGSLVVYKYDDTGGFIKIKGCEFSQVAYNSATRGLVLPLSQEKIDIEIYGNLFLNMGTGMFVDTSGFPNDRNYNQKYIVNNIFDGCGLEILDSVKLDNLDISKNIFRDGKITKQGTLSNNWRNVVLDNNTFELINDTIGKEYFIQIGIPTGCSFKNNIIKNETGGTPTNKYKFIDKSLDLFYTSTILENKDVNGILDDWTDGGSIGDNIEANNIPSY